MKKSLNILLFISFVITTIMAPVTGIHKYVVESYDNLSGYPSDHFYCSGILFGCSYFCVS